MRLVMKRIKKIRILDVDISRITQSQLIEAVLRGTKEPGQKSLIFLNTDVVIKSESDAYLKKIIN